MPHRYGPHALLDPTHSRETEIHNFWFVGWYECVRDVPRIPLIDDLTAEPIPTGSNLLVEFAGASQWYNASLTVTAGWLRQGGKVSYNTYAQSPEDIRSKLGRLGLNVQQLENEDKLRIWDWYTATLGQRSKEKYAFDSLKVADLSILFSRQIMREPPQPEWLRINDNASTLARFNDERIWVEFILTRGLPRNRLRKSTAIIGLARGVHSGWVYEQLEASVDGIIDFKIDEVHGERRTLMGIRIVRDVDFDSRWYPLKMRENFEITIDK